MNFLTRYWKTGLLFLANTIYSYYVQEDLIKKAILAEAPADYQAIVNKHIQRAIEERNKPKEKFPAPYFYMKGSGVAAKQEQERKAIAQDFQRTLAYNNKVDNAYRAAGIPVQDTYSDLMSRRFTDG